MLPFLKARKRDTTILAQTKPEGSIEPVSQDNHALLASAEDIIAAIQAKDAGALASAIQAAFEICNMGEAIPESEG